MVSLLDLGCAGSCRWRRRGAFMLRYNEELDRFFDPHSKDRLAAAQAAKNAQQYLMQLAEDRDRRMRIAEALARDARMAAAAAERARVYLEELVEKRKETLPEILKESEADDGFLRCPFLRPSLGCATRSWDRAAVTPSPRQCTGL